TQYVCPAPLDPELSAAIQRIAEQSYIALKCEGWGRADFMLDGAGKPWLLEMNTSPGMTSHSLVPMGAKAAGMSYPELCLEILSTAACKVQAPPSVYAGDTRVFRRPIDQLHCKHAGLAGRACIDLGRRGVDCATALFRHCEDTDRTNAVRVPELCVPRQRPGHHRRADRRQFLFGRPG